MQLKLEIIQQIILLGCNKTNITDKLQTPSYRRCFFIPKKLENNFNFIELGPKGTGKSHIFSELSPHGVLVSGGDVSKARLFVNNTGNKIGLVGYWDVVALDEFEQEKGHENKMFKDDREK